MEPEQKKESSQEKAKERVKWKLIKHDRIDSYCDYHNFMLI